MTQLLTASSLLALSAALFACQGQRKEEGNPNRHSGDARPEESGPAAENDATGTYRGYEEINRIVNERLFARSDALSLRLYVEEHPPTDSIFDLGKPTLKDLLGVYDGDGLRVGLKNGTPNSVNMLLWYMAMDGLANELALGCQGEAGAHFALVDVQPSVTDLVNKICATPDARSKDEATLRDLWNVVMRTDAPETEYLAWRNYVQGGSFTETGSAAVHSMLLAMLYNPHFLLKK